MEPRTARRILAILMGLIMCWTIAGCSLTSDAPPNKPDRPKVTGPIFDRIPDNVTTKFFPGPPNPPNPTVHDWAPQTNGTTPPLSLQRNLPPCDGGGTDIEADQVVHEFRGDVRTTSKRFVISRQLTLYGSAEEARSVLTQMRAATVTCPTTLAGKPVTGATRTGYLHDKNFDVNPGDDGTGTWFAEGEVSTRTDSFFYVDVLSLRGNAVMFTRVGKMNADRRGMSIMFSKRQNPGFVDQVKRFGNDGVQALTLLP